MLTILVSIIGCNEELPLSPDFKETAIIYGLLDQNEQIHFIKINRAFIGPGNSLDIAKIPDSSYFKNVDAKITEVGGLNRTWTLKDTIITNKDTNGVFYGPEQKLYYFDNGSTPLNVDATYKLSVTIDKGLSTEFIVNGETQLVKSVALTNTSSFKLNLLESNGNFRSVSMEIAAGNAATINTKFTLLVDEYENQNLNTIEIPWTIGEQDAGASTYLTFKFNGETFYNIVKAGLTDNSLINKRNFNGVKITITGGSSDLHNYILINKPSSSLSQSKPTFTNLTVNTNSNNVIGLFSARQTVVYNYKFMMPNDSYYRLLDKRSTQELCTGSITTYLDKFCSLHPQDISENYHCQ
ncbi:MAG: hypothetical protein HYR91_09775 [Flavobacteriia bacterium]|nr:hypothetical protein [Flavobacteriia bacterium]